MNDRVYSLKVLNDERDVVYASVHGSFDDCVNSLLSFHKLEPSLLPILHSEHFDFVIKEVR